MTCFNKKQYKVLKRSAKKAGDVFVGVKKAYHTDGYAGVSVAFRPSIEGGNGRMVEVSVSYCSPNDEFKKKHGKYQALSKLARGEIITMPLAGALRSSEPSLVLNELLDIFLV